MIRRTKSARRSERGQTIVLVAISIVSLLMMAALAIDLATLYVARGQAQRAADAAALAGAKAIADSGVTTAPADTNLQTLAANMATASINASVARNLVSGVAPTLVGTPTPNFATLGDPQITVTVQRANLPTYFARVFGQRLATVSATAIGEAYNSSNATGAGAASMPAVAPSCVKPWLVANIDPNHGPGVVPFVNADGSIAHPGVWVPTAPGTCNTVGSGGIIGECIPLPNLWMPIVPTLLGSAGYWPAALNNAASTTACASCASTSGGNFAQSIACCDTANASQYACGSTAGLLSVDSAANDLADTLGGAACLISGVAGATGGTPGQDTIDLRNFQSSNGADPMEITAGAGPQLGNVVSTSGQIVTLPIISVSLAGVNATVIGYMQAFVQGTSATGVLTVNVLNISGCGSNINNGVPAVSGGGASAVPVRLIHQ